MQPELRGIILAGGAASRLGPLHNKAAVPVASQPMVIHQLLQLRRAGCTSCRVVVSDHTQFETINIIERAGIPDVDVVVQRKTGGPIRALNRALDRWWTDGELLVLLADTLISDEDLQRLTPNSVGVSPAPAAREWDDDKFERRYCQRGELVTNGSYRLDAARTVVRASNTSGHMGEFLRSYRTLDTVRQDSWVDLGDLGALASAQRARVFNKVNLNKLGTVIKSGPDVRWEANRMRANPLHPRILDIGDTWYEMEYVDLPSLAELWLYRPGGDAAWSWIIDNIVKRLESDYWTPCAKLPTWRAAERWRLLDPSHQLFPGSSVMAGKLYKIEDQLDASSVPVAVHGDLNFSNVLYSMRTGFFKLLDPSPRYDARYDAGKLLMSPYWNAIIHGLYEFDGDEVKLWPQRDEEIAALRELLESHFTMLPVIVPYLLLSCAPLHPGEEGQALAQLGKQMLAEARW